jgi:hypothetical protein
MRELDWIGVDVDHPVDTGIQTDIRATATGA